jgi:phosphoglucomutase/phosphomannomutase
VQSSVARLEQAVADGRIDPEVAGRIRRWLTDPALGEFSGAVAALLDADDTDELVRLFWEDIPFGTGGRRGVMGPLGTATINSRTIAESAHGLARHLQDTGHTSGRIAVAHDTRNRSVEFARLVSTTFAAHGFEVLEFDGHRATPTLSFTVRHLECVAGVVISASHNPPSDNGFKAYWSHGGQVLPPHDTGIVECVAGSTEIPTMAYDQAVADGHITRLGPEIDQAYRRAVLASRPPAPDLQAHDPATLPGLYTPLCGVGASSVLPVLHEAGFVGVELFQPQADPDGDFTAVPDQLPNPERPEVFAPAIAAAGQNGQVLVLATDPDADRLAVAAPDPGGVWRVMTGNQLAVVLLDHLLGHHDRPPEAYMLTTLVTTPLLGVLCRSRGVQAVDDLPVGFKHIAKEMEERGPEGFVFGCEESIGFQAGTYCRDKDAAVAALLVADVALELHAENRTVWHRLDDIFSQHGRVDEFQHSVFAHGPSGRKKIDQAMESLRHQPPSSTGGHSWSRVRDYQTHEIRSLPDNRADQALPTPSTNLLVFESNPVHSPMITLAVRPSGTEPKIKFYGFARQLEPGDADTRTAIDQLEQGLVELLQTLIC